MLDELLGPYRLISELGAGGMGKVYLAQVEADAPGLPVGERVAVKVIYPHLVTDFSMFQRFVREATVGKRIRHENVVRTLDAGMAVTDDGEWVYLVMEYVAGKTLGEMRRENGRLSEDVCRRVAREVARALRGIHEAGVIHRDLKPDNVIITADGVVKVMDLGVAKLQEEVMKQTRAGGFAGSLTYAAPEQFGGAGDEVDGRVDLYSLGVMLYELSTGENPFADDDVHVVINRQLEYVPPPVTRIDPGLSLFFAQVVRQLMEKEPAKRIRSADSLFRILGEAEQSRWWRQETARMLRGDREPLRRLPVPRRTDVHGRESELAELRRLFQRAKFGETRVVLVEGEAGVGKSRLLDELVMILEMGGEELEFLFGIHRPEAFAGVDEALNSALREHFGRATLATMARQFAGQGEAADALVRLVAAEPGQGDDCGQVAGGDLVRFAAHLLRLLAQARPVVFLLEDLHLAAEGGLEQFEALADAVVGARVLLAATSRRDLPPRWLAEFRERPATQIVRLRRLGERPLSGMLAEALGSGVPDEALIAAVAKRSDGNPLFALDVLREIRDRSLLRKTSRGTWSSARPLSDLEVPPGVRKVVRERLLGLDEEDLDTLHVAACAGFRFDPSMVAEVLGEEEIVCIRRLARLGKRRRLVRAVGEHFNFDHRALRDSLYADLSQLLREEYHRMLGDVLLERAGGVDAGDLPGETTYEIAHHLLLAGDASQAREYLTPALVWLDEKDRHTDVLLIVDQALHTGEDDDPGRICLLVRKALALCAVGRTDGVTDTLREALDAVSPGET